MATIALTKAAVGSKDSNAYTINYEAITEADTGAAFELPEYIHLSVQVAGTFGAGDISIEGSNDGVTWATMSDPAGNALTFSAAGFKNIDTPARYIRPGKPTGTGVDLDVFFLAVRGISVRA